MPIKITAANAGWASQFRIRGCHHKSGMAEFWTLGVVGRPGRYDCDWLHSFDSWHHRWRRWRGHVFSRCLQAQIVVVFRLPFYPDSLLDFLFPEHEGHHQAIRPSGARLAFGRSGWLYGRNRLVWRMSSTGDIKFEVRQNMLLISNSLRAIRHFCFDANPCAIGRRGLRRNRNVWAAVSSDLSHFQLEFTWSNKSLI